MIDFKKLDDAGTPDEMRAAMRKGERDEPMLSQVFRQAMYTGMSGEDTYVTIAYLALRQYHTMRELVIENIKELTTLPVGNTGKQGEVK